MKSSVLKLLPYVVGIGLGILLFNPPAFLQGLGALTFVLTAALVLLLFLVFVGLSLLGTYPADLKLEPAADTTLPPDMQLCNRGATKRGAVAWARTSLARP